MEDGLTQSQHSTTGEIVGTVFYIAPAGHKYEPGQTFPNPGEFREGVMGSPSASYWVAIATDGTRRVLGRSNGLPSHFSHTWADDLLESYPGSHVHLVRNPWREHPGGDTWMGYDWLPKTEPVNQVPFLNTWKAFVARAAHEFDWTMGAHSLDGLSDNEQWTVQHQMYGLISAPWLVMFILEAADPTAEIAGKLLWKTYQTSAEEVLAGLCHECEDTAVFARQFAQEANLELFRGALVQGKVYEADRDLAPWGLSDNIVTQALAPVGQTPTAEKIAQFHRQSRTAYLSALKYYSTHVGTSERPHSHD